MKINVSFPLSLLILAVAFVIAVPVQAQHPYDPYWDGYRYNASKYPNYRFDTYWHDNCRQDPYRYDTYWNNQYLSRPHYDGTYRYDSYGRRYYYLEPVHFADLDVNYIGLHGDINEFFMLDDSLAALVDNAWVFRYSGYWSSIIRVKEPAVVTGDPPLLIVPGKEVWRSIPPDEMQYATVDHSQWDLAFEVPENIRIYTGTTFRSAASMRTIQFLHEQHDERASHYPRDLIIGGEKLREDSTRVGILLVKTANSSNWSEIELAGHGAVRNLTAYNSYVIFTQGHEIYELEMEPYHARALYSDLTGQDPITCFDTHSNFPTLAGTEDGHLLYASGTAMWQQLDHRFRRPVQKICGPYIITGDGNINRLWSIRWEPTNDRLDPQRFSIDEVPLPSGFTPLSLYYDNSRFICGGTNGQILQLQETPYREYWVSSYRHPHYSHGHGVVVATERRYLLPSEETSAAADDKSHLPSFEKYGRTIPEPIDFPEPTDEPVVEQPVKQAIEQPIYVPEPEPTNPIVTPRPIDRPVYSETSDPDVRDDPPEPQPRPRPVPKPTPVVKKPKPTPKPTPVKSQPTVKPAPKPTPSPAKPKPTTPPPTKKEEPKKETPPASSDKPKPKPKSSSNSK